jgi:sulfate adenylyltransferase
LFFIAFYLCNKEKKECKGIVDRMLKVKKSDKILHGDVKELLKKESNNYRSWQLTDRQLCDLELLMNGSFSPLTGFMTKKDYESVVKNMRLDNGHLWPIPITLDITTEFYSKIKNEKKITLKDKEGFPLALLKVEEIWEPNLNDEADLVYGTQDHSHPAVNYIFNLGNKIYIGGAIEKISFPHHYDYVDDRHSPEKIQSIFKEKGWEKIVAFQTRNPLHRAHVEMTKQAIKKLKAKLLLHPVVGMTKPGDVDHYTRVRCYKHVMKKYSNNSAILSLLPLAMRMGGPREALCML